MAEIKKKTAPEKPAVPAENAQEAQELHEKRDEHHHHPKQHHDHVISPPYSGSSYLNPGAIRIGR